MRLTELSDSEILLKLDGLAQEKGVDLRFAHRSFYIALLHYCEEHGLYDSTASQYYVELTVPAFAETLSISRTAVIQSLKLLSLCGAIRRVTPRRAFRRVSKDEFVKNRPSRTYVNTVYLNLI